MSKVPCNILVVLWFMNEQETIIKVVNLHPFLRWAGGKRWLVQKLKNVLDINDFHSYHEPFLGGGAMFFHYMPSNAYISDANFQLINAYLKVRDNIEDVINSIKDFGCNESSYYRIRSLQTENSVLQAARFIYLNQLSYNGIYRVNKKGEYNVPWGKRDNYQFDFENLRNVSIFLNQGNIHISHGDFNSTLSSIQKDDLVFLDPPYIYSDFNNPFIQYNQKSFSTSDQQRLSDFIDRLKELGAYYILSNSNHDKTKILFNKGDNIIEVTRSSGIGGKNAQRGDYKECIFTNINFTI